MDWNDAETMARSLMNEHGLAHVSFKGNNRKTAAGITKFIGTTVISIELSRPVVEANAVELVRDTVLHEIAHALVGHAAGHGWTWKAKARELGAQAERTCGDGVVAPQGKYQAECSCKMSVHHLHRTPRRAYRCALNNQPLTFKKVG